MGDVPFGNIAPATNSGNEYTGYFGKAWKVLQDLPQDFMDDWPMFGSMALIDGLQGKLLGAIEDPQDSLMRENIKRSLTTGVGDASKFSYFDSQWVGKPEDFPTPENQTSIGAALGSFMQLPADLPLIASTTLPFALIEYLGIMTRQSFPGLTDNGFGNTVGRASIATAFDYLKFSYWDGVRYMSAQPTSAV